MSPILGTLEAYGLHPTGRDRYRARCPSCGERSNATLSIGLTGDGTILLRCFKDGCSVEAITSALGLSVASLFPSLPQPAAPLKRRRMLGAQQALDLLERETLVAFVICSDVANSRTLKPEDWQRLQQAIARVQQIAQEVRE